MNIAAITNQMEEGLSTSVFSAAVLLVSHQNKIVFHEGFGQRRIKPKDKQTSVDLQTIFDLASLTKPLVTTAAIAQLLQQNRLCLHDPLQKFLPDFFGKKKSQVTIFHLLNHSSGLPAWQPYYLKIQAQEKKTPGFLGTLSAKQAIFKMAHAEELKAHPGEISRYSDIGFILLGEVVEKICEMPLNTYFSKYIVSALKQSEIFFPQRPENPQDIINTDTLHFAATEDSKWRKGVISGIVHDDNAYAMGGIAGHAGLFATAHGVYQLVQTWLDSIKGKGFLSPEIAEKFVSRQKDIMSPTGASWALGWDSPSVSSGRGSLKVSSSGYHFSPSSFGHLGFTGTSIWVDRTHELVVIFLSNRVHPSRENERIRSFRPKLHDLIFETLIHA